MSNILITILLVLSVILVIAIMMQPTKTDSALSSLGSGELFANAKPRGFEAVMQKVTAVLLALFLMTAIALMFIGK